MPCPVVKGLCNFAKHILKFGYPFYMKSIRISLPALLLLMLLHHQSQAQLDAFASPRVSVFQGSFGQAFTGIGFELGFTLQDPVKPWAGGFHYQGNFLGSIDETAYAPYLHVLLNSFNFHFGGKGSINSFIHPYAYGIAGLRVLSYTDPDLGSDAEAFFNTFTLTYGIKTGIQVGSGQWRADLKLDYVRGSSTRYLVEETFQEAYEVNADYMDFVKRSPLNNIALGIGVVYVIE